MTSTASPVAIWAAMIGLYFMWGSTYLAIAEVVAEMPPLISMGGRYLGAGLIVLLFVLVRRGPQAFARPRKEYLRSAIEGLILLLLGNGLLSLGEREVPSGIAALLFAAMPMWIAVLRFSAGDRPSLLTRLGIFIGFSGTAVLVLNGNEAPTQSAATLAFWSLVVLASAFFWALGSFIGPRITAERDLMLGIGLQVSTGGFFLILTGFATGEENPLSNLSGYSSSAIFGWFWLLTIGALIGYSTYLWLLHNAPISLVSTYAYVNPIVAVILGATIHDETIRATAFIGALAMIGGVVLVTRGEKQKR